MMPRNGASYWIERLGLQPHPEGGYFRETYRSTATIDGCCLAPGYDGPRAVSTAIYFLLEGTQTSRLHRLRSDEMWHHYAGAALELHLIRPDGTHACRRVGPGARDDEAPQLLVEAGVWFGATVCDPDSYALVGCTVAPGFDFRDFEMPGREELLRRFPRHREIIARLSR